VDGIAKIPAPTMPFTEIAVRRQVFAISETAIRKRLKPDVALR